MEGGGWDVREGGVDGNIWEGDDGEFAEGEGVFGVGDGFDKVWEVSVGG